MYSVRQFPRDALAGVTVACLLVPQSLSYAQAIVHIPPIHGLFTCFAPLVVYSLLGTSRQLGVGPEALISILVAAAANENIAAKPQQPSPSPPGSNSWTQDDPLVERVAVANMLALMVGFFTFLLGFFRLGFLDSVLSRALLRGFVTAVAFVVMIEQSAPMLGLPETVFDLATHQPQSPMDIFFRVIQNLSEAHIPTTIVSIASIVFLVSFKIAKNKYPKQIGMIPEILILVVLAIISSWWWRLDLAGVDIMKDVEGGFQSPTLPKMAFSRMRYYILSSILISVIGFVESIVIAKTYATKYNYAISPNRELVAIGVANVAGSLFGGWPAFGSLSRSAVNDGAGGRSQVSGLVTAFIVLITMLYLLPAFYFLPKAACSAIIVVAATRLIEMHDIEFIIRMRAWNDLGLLLLTFLTTLFVSIEVGTLISVGTSLLLVVKHTTKTRIEILGRVFVQDTPSSQVKTKYRPLSEPGSRSIDGVLILRIEEGLFFGNTGQLKDRLKRIEMHGALHVHPGEAPRRIAHEDSSDSRRRSRSRHLDIEAAASSGTEQTRRTSTPSVDVSELFGIVFDFSAVNAIDAGATQILLEIVEAYQARGILVYIVKLRESCKPMFARSGIESVIGSSAFVDKISEALEDMKRAAAESPVANHGGPLSRRSVSLSLNHPPDLRFAGGSDGGLLEEDEGIPYVHPRDRAAVAGDVTGEELVVGTWGSDTASAAALAAGGFAGRISRASFVSALGDSFRGGFAVEAANTRRQQRQAQQLEHRDSLARGSFEGSRDDLDYASDAWD
ncbi:Solute carrier 26 [Entophlyctis luteolus]|nr:Solute carrier 26 [Entophlyctis luteolus]